MSEGWEPFARGTFAAVVTMAVAMLLPRTMALNLLAVILGVTAGVYLGFAVLDGRARELGIEVAGIIFFAAFAVLGLH